jgi:hypothetical protein
MLPFSSLDLSFLICKMGEEGPNASQAPSIFTVPPANSHKHPSSEWPPCPALLHCTAEASAYERLLCHEVGWASGLEPHRKLLPRGSPILRTVLCSFHLLPASSASHLGLCVSVREEQHCPPRELMAMTQLGQGRDGG